MAGRSLGLKCEITDLLNCQVCVTRIPQIGEYEASIKSALLTNEKRLKRIFGDLDEFLISEPDEEYNADMEEYRRLYQVFLKELSEKKPKKQADSTLKFSNTPPSQNQVEQVAPNAASSSSQPKKK